MYNIFVAIFQMLQRLCHLGLALFTERLPPSFLFALIVLLIWLAVGDARGRG